MSNFVRVDKDSLVVEYMNLFPKDIADQFFEQLEKQIEYFTDDKWIPIRRKHALYGISYAFSGNRFPAKPWILLLLEIKTEVEKWAGELFNVVVINRYEDGADYIGQHKDDEKEILPYTSVASVSFGAERDFTFKRDGHKSVTMKLQHGSLLIMKYPTNCFWTHGLPVRRRVKEPRINLTFRHVIGPLTSHSVY